MPPNSRMITLDSPLFKCCHKLKTLSWHHDAEAKSLLQRAADQVKPIMARRKWTVLLLTEFYPPVPNLLGLNHNHGDQIDLRLRSPSNHLSFLPYRTILATLLHELAHIQVGPHNPTFYKLLDQLNTECEHSMLSSAVIQSSPFNGTGNRLGDCNARNLPRHIAREKAALAVQNRYNISAIMSRGGARLGGSAEVFHVCDPREMALAAAERRRADDVWCATLKPTSSSSTTPHNHPHHNTNHVIVISDDEDLSIPATESTRPVHQTSDKTSTLPAPKTTPAIPIRKSPAARAALRRAARRTLSLQPFSQ